MTKHAGGAPRKYKSVRALQSKIDKYFKLCEENNEFPTIGGLAFAVDLSRGALITYSNRDEFERPLKKARQLVEIALEKRLMSGSGNVAGTIFNLKNNFGWRDKIESTLNANVSVSDLTDEQVITKIKQISEQIAQTAVKH